MDTNGARKCEMLNIAALAAFVVEVVLFKRPYELDCCNLFMKRLLATVWEICKVDRVYLSDLVDYTSHVQTGLVLAGLTLRHDFVCHFASE